MKVLIVGGVAGGAGAAARLRRNDEKAKIIMLEKGEFISFANCGLPYYIGKVIEKKDDLLIQTPEAFKARFNVDVRTENEVLSVDVKDKSVLIKDLKNERAYRESYDKLILSPGAKPAKPPIKGADRENVFMLRGMNDALNIKDYIAEKRPKTAVVIGGGYIGLEMADNLHNAGLSVSIVEAMPHVIGPLDSDMAAEVHNHIRDKGVNLFLSSKAVEIGRSDITLENGHRVEADIVIMSIGVSPETAFLKDSGIALGQKGEILVNRELKTNIKDIYALGDAVAVTNIVAGQPQLIPLASPANKQARIVADIVAGKKAKYTGAQGTAIAKVFDMTVGVTGLSETQLIASNIKYQKSITYSNSHASYYPGGSPMAVKLLFEPKTGKLLGGQITGEKGVDKRVDVLAAAVRHNMTVFDLQELELAYAPPFSSAKDPLNMAGYVAGNIIEGMCRPIYAEELKDLSEDALLFDIRTPREYDCGTIGGAVNFELDKLRDNLGNIPKDKELIIFCRIGLRGHIAQQILEQNGFKTRNLIGGYRFYEQIKKDNPQF